MKSSPAIFAPEKMMLGRGSGVPKGMENVQGKLLVLPSRDPVASPNPTNPE